MARNDVVLLDGILDQHVAECLPSHQRDEVFEYLAFEQVLKDYDLSQEEIENGWVDGRDDGGVDKKRGRVMVAPGTSASHTPLISPHPGVTLASQTFEDK
jgi:hypothetical protein